MNVFATTQQFLSTSCPHELVKSLQTRLIDPEESQR